MTGMRKKLQKKFGAVEVTVQMLAVNWYESPDYIDLYCFWWNFVADGF